MLPLNYCRRIAAWLFEQLAHLQLQQATPEASGAGSRTYHLVSSLLHWDATAAEQGTLRLQ